MVRHSYSKFNFATVLIYGNTDDSKNVRIKNRFSLSRYIAHMHAHEAPAQTLEFSQNHSWGRDLALY